jgi:hypothetical protein
VFFFVGKEFLLEKLVIIFEIYGVDLFGCFFVLLDAITGKIELLFVIEGFLCFWRGLEVIKVSISVDFAPLGEFFERLLSDIFAVVGVLAVLEQTINDIQLFIDLILEKLVFLFEVLD